MAKGKKTLKAALVSQQTRLKNNRQAKEAAQAAELRERARRDVALKREGGSGLGGVLRKSFSSSSTASISSSSTSTPVKITTPSRKRFVAAPAASATSSPSSKPSLRRSATSTIPFSATDRILLIGEGDFSFAHALVVHPPPHAAALAHLPPANVVATAYDREDECYAKYPRAAALVDALRGRGAVVLFGVDATRLDRCAALKGRRFDRVVWNFPHAGASIADQDRNIRANQELLLAFLRSVPSVLARGRVPQAHTSRKRKREDDDEDDAQPSDDDDDKGGTRGTVLIALRNVPPYTDWDLPQLAKNPPAPRIGEPASPRYTQLRSFAFHRDDWPGYAHQMTKGERAHGTGTTGQSGEDRTWEFCIS